MTPDEPAVIDYENWRGERALRRILPKRLFFGESAWHPGAQWLLEAEDLDKGQVRVFAMSEVRAWRKIHKRTEMEKADGQQSPA